eukprot:m.294016 g.294016  ORF g.294016 m.294016 type:complete len:479 (-) comp36454_c0_seq1:103-1539(-)
MLIMHGVPIGNMTDHLQQREDLTHLDVVEGGGLRVGLDTQGVPSTSNPNWMEQRASLDPPANHVVTSGAAKVLKMGYMGHGMTVGVLSSGVNHLHPSLIGNYRGLQADGSFNHSYNWLEPFDHETRTPNDNTGLGTHVTGTIVGPLNGIGLAPSSQFTACRVLSLQGTQTVEAMTSCLQFMLAPFDLNGRGADPMLAPDIVLLGFNCPQCPLHTFSNAAKALRAAGIAAIAEAGERVNGAGRCDTLKLVPAIDEDVFTVGAAENDTVAGFSAAGLGRGSGRIKPNLIAEGVLVLSSVGSNAFVGANGTSMSAAVAAGGVALLWSAVPELNGMVDVTYSILEESAMSKTSDEGCGGDGPSQVPNHVYGHGIMNVERAVILGIKKVRGARCLACLEPCFELVGETQQACLQACDKRMCEVCAKRKKRVWRFELRVARAKKCVPGCVGRTGRPCQKCARRLRRVSNRLARKVRRHAQRCEL